MTGSVFAFAVADGTRLGVGAFFFAGGFFHGGSPFEKRILRAPFINAPLAERKNFQPFRVHVFEPRINPRRRFMDFTSITSVSFVAL